MIRFHQYVMIVGLITSLILIDILKSLRAKAPVNTGKNLTQCHWYSITEMGPNGKIKEVQFVLFPVDTLE